MHNKRGITGTIVGIPVPTGEAVDPELERFAREIETYDVTEVVPRPPSAWRKIKATGFGIMIVLTCVGVFSLIEPLVEGAVHRMDRIIKTVEGLW